MRPINPCNLRDYYYMCVDASQLEGRVHCKKKFILGFFYSKGGLFNFLISPTTLRVYFYSSKDGWNIGSLFNRRQVKSLKGLLFSGGCVLHLASIWKPHWPWWRYTFPLMRQVTKAFSPIANEDISSRMRPVVLLRWVDVYLVLVVAL